MTTPESMPTDEPIPTPGACLLETKLPEGLQGNDLSTIKTGVTQWSRIVAWTWCDYLAFDDKKNKPEPEKKQYEIDLKKLLVKVLQKQAQEADAYLSYGDPESKNNADEWGKAILNLLLGKTQEVPGGENIALTLSDVLKKITGEELVTSIPKNERFTKSFFVQVITKSFSGYITDAPDECKTEATKYINFIAYPPRPELGELTVTEAQLMDWANNPDPRPGGNYLPPSVYIPTAFS